MSCKSAESTALQSSSDHDLRVACYCEENAWRLAYRHINSTCNNNNNNSDDDDIDWKYYIVFISNDQKCCPMFKQRATPEDDPNEYVCWDYHVIVMRTQQNSTIATATSTQILDIDTWIRPYPTPLSQYLDESFPHASDPTFNKQYLPLFHVIKAEDFIREFYSDRSHMFKNGKWSSPPPDYPPIMNGLKIITNDDHDGNERMTGSNLDSYISMSGETKKCVYTLAEMYERSKDSNTSEWTI